MKYIFIFVLLHNYNKNYITNDIYKFDEYYDEGYINCTKYKKNNDYMMFNDTNKKNYNYYF